MTKTGTREMDNDKRTEQGKIKKEKLSFGEYELVKHSKIYEGKVFNVVVDDIRSHVFQPFQHFSKELFRETLII